MTDRELLELAAKAAGLKLYEHVPGLIVTGSPDTKDVDYERWNPLDDDGDALRLAVKLGIEPKGPSRSRSIGRVVQAWFPPDGNPDRSANRHVSSQIDGDRYAATRRAIVRAAAEIGRAMK